MADNGPTRGASSSDEGCLVLQGNLPNSVFNELRKSEELVDVRLEVGNKQFAAHRVVLAATMPYFRTMFTIEMRERSNDVIKIKANIDESSFESLIDYVYGEDLGITSLNVQSLLVAASYFQFDRVSDACCEFVQRRLNISNVVEVQKLGDTLGCVSLDESAKEFVCRNFDEVAKLGDFVSLSFNEIIEIISKDELKVNYEETVFEAVTKWVKHDEKSRKDHFPDLLAHVRLPLMTLKYLTDCVASEKLVQNSKSCRALLDEANDYHLMPKRRHLLQSVRCRPRCSHLAGLIYVVGGLNNSGDSVNTVEAYNCELNTWTTDAEITTGRHGHGVAVLDRKLYAIGGCNTTGRQYLSTVEVFDGRSNWTNFTPMSCKRGHFGVATLDDKLYACGGSDGASLLNTVECYDHQKDEWQMMPCMSQKREGVGVVAFQGSIVVLGGQCNGATDLVESFDPESKSWTVLPSMKTKRHGVGAAVLGNKIYVCGGWDGSNLETAEVFDPQTNNWSFIASMKEKRYGVALVANGGKLFAIGGEGEEDSDLSSVEVYNPEINEWSFLAPMSERKSFVGVGVIAF